jgi:hypothetical protein
MRKRSIPVLVIALAAWILAWWLTEALMLAPFGYRTGSTFSAATYLRLTAFLALLSSLVGLYLLAIDFVQWVRGKE